jgi:hypothetical protein
MLPFPLQEWVVLVPQEYPERRDLPISVDFLEEFLAGDSSFKDYSEEEEEQG